MMTIHLDNRLLFNKFNVRMDPFEFSNIYIQHFNTCSLLTNS